MSHNTFEVHFADGTVKHGMYIGGSSTYTAALFDDPQQAWQAKDIDRRLLWPDFVPDSGEVVQVRHQRYAWSATATKEALTSWHSAERLGDRFEQENPHLPWPHWPTLDSALPPVGVTP